MAPGRAIGPVRLRPDKCAAQSAKRATIRARRRNPAHARAGQIHEQVVGPDADERNRWRKRARVAPPLGLLLVVDEEPRSVRLLLLGKAAVLAHRYERPLAAEMDDEERPAHHGSASRRTVPER